MGLAQARRPNMHTNKMALASKKHVVLVSAALVITVFALITLSRETGSAAAERGSRSDSDGDVKLQRHDKAAHQMKLPPSAGSSIEKQQPHTISKL